MPDESRPRPPAARSPRPLPVVAGGILLFLFIPVVLYLLVAHPEPVGASLLAAVVLMLGHRFLARPYMGRVREAKCLWCNRVPPRSGGAAGGVEVLPLETGGGPVEARCCAGHRAPVARYFAFAWRWRHVLRVGIFLPLLLLVAALAATALGFAAPLPAAVDLFRLSVGITVNLAAWGYLAASPEVPARVPFPAHNFFLLGLWPLLWIFRLVGIWWIWKGATGLFGG